MNVENAVFMDVNDAMTRLGNNKKLYAMLLNKFDGKSMLDDLKKKLRSGDVPASAAQAHTIKGLAANLSLKDLREKSETVELIIKSGAYPDTDTMDTSEIERSVEYTLAAVKEWIGQNT